MMSSHTLNRSGWRPAAEELSVVAFHRAQPADHCHLFDGRDAGRLPDRAERRSSQCRVGHVGIMWKRFRGGTRLDPRLLKDEGMRVLLPWDKLFLYDLRLQTDDDTYNAISKDGVNLTATINIRFRLKHDAVPQLHQTIGPTTSRECCTTGNRQPRARDFRRIHRRRNLFDQAPGDVQKGSAPTPRTCLARARCSATETESEYGEHYQDIAGGVDSIFYDTLVLGIVAAGDRERASIARSSNIICARSTASASSARQKESERKKIEAEGIRDFQQTVTPGYFRFLRALARHRGDAATRAVAEHQDRDHRQRQRRPAGHSRQRRYADAAKSGGARRLRATGAVLPDNSEAAKQKPSAASPPLLEKTPASNLPAPSERPSPTAVPSAPSDKPQGAPPRFATERARPNTAPGKPSQGTAGQGAAHLLDLVRIAGADFANRGRGDRPLGGQPRSPRSGPTPRPRRENHHHPPAGPPPPRPERAPPRPPER